MTFGLVALIVICGWSLLSIVASLTIGAIAAERDSEPFCEEASPRRQHLAS
jgi:hypothetical protein